MASSAKAWMTFGQKYGGREKGVLILLILVLLSIVNNNSVSADHISEKNISDTVHMSDDMLEEESKRLLVAR